VRNNSIFEITSALREGLDRAWGSFSGEVNALKKSAHHPIYHVNTKFENLWV